MCVKDLCLSLSDWVLFLGLSESYWWKECGPSGLVPGCLTWGPPCGGRGRRVPLFFEHSKVCNYINQEKCENKVSLTWLCKRSRSDSWKGMRWDMYAVCFTTGPDLSFGWMDGLKRCWPLQQLKVVLQSIDSEGLNTNVPHTFHIFSCEKIWKPFISFDMTLLLYQDIACISRQNVSKHFACLAKRS